MSGWLRGAAYFWNLRIGPVAGLLLMAHVTYEASLTITEASVPLYFPYVKM